MPDSQPNLQDLSNSQIGLLPSAYLDTTVVANALLRSDETGKRCGDAIRRFPRSEMPEYAIKELKAGPLSAWIWCHNKFNETKSFADTVAAINSISATPRRNFSASARQAFEQAAQADKASFAQVLEVTERVLDRTLADRYRYYLRRRIAQAWERRRTVATEISMPLLCFIEGQLQANADGGLSFERYSCPRDPKCGVLAELSKRREDVGRLLEAIKKEPDKLENQKRYQALRHIFRTPTRPFSDSMCRSLGDAVFALMAPQDSVILTTNLKDHTALAGALGKMAAAP